METEVKKWTGKQKNKSELDQAFLLSQQQDKFHTWKVVDYKAKGAGLKHYTPHTNTNEIPGHFNLTLFGVKGTISYETIQAHLVWYFIGVCNTNKTVAGCCLQTRNDLSFVAVMISITLNRFFRRKKDSIFKYFPGYLYLNNTSVR